MGPERRVRVGRARRRRAAPVEGGLDGDGGVTRAVESQGLSVTRLSRVTGDDAGQIVCDTKGARGWTRVTNDSRRFYEFKLISKPVETVA